MRVRVCAHTQAQVLFLRYSSPLILRQGLLVAKKVTSRLVWLAVELQGSILLLNAGMLGCWDYSIYHYVQFLKFFFRTLCVSTVSSSLPPLISPVSSPVYVYTAD